MSAPELVDVTILPATEAERDLWVVCLRWSEEGDNPDRAYLQGGVVAWRFETWVEGPTSWTARTPIGEDCVAERPEGDGWESLAYGSHTEAVKRFHEILATSNGVNR